MEYQLSPISCSPVRQFVSIMDTDFCLTDCRIITSILKNKRKKSRSWKPGYTLAISTLDPPLKAVWPWGPAPQLSCSFFFCKQGSVTSPTLPIIYMTLCSLPVYSSLSCWALSSPRQRYWSSCFLLGCQCLAEGLTQCKAEQ